MREIVEEGVIRCFFSTGEEVEDSFEGLGRVTAERPTTVRVFGEGEVSEVGPGGL